MARTTARVKAEPSLIDERRSARRAGKAAIKRKQTPVPKTVRARPTRAVRTGVKKAKSKAWMELPPLAKKALRRAGISDIPDVTIPRVRPQIKPALPTVSGLPAPMAAPTRTRPSLGHRARRSVSQWRDAEMLPVVSSNVGSIGYDEDLNELYIQFLDGSIYEYYDVPRQVWRRFQTAPSKGKFVWRNIRDIYAYRRAS